MTTKPTSCSYCDSSLRDEEQPCGCAESVSDDCAGRSLQEPQLQQQGEEQQDNHEFFDAMDKLAVGGRDSSIFRYILKQKDEMIQELREKVYMLNHQMELLAECRKNRYQSPKRFDGRINVKVTSRKLIVGTNPSIQANGKKLKGVPNYTILHVHRTDPNMTCDDLEALLRDRFPEVRCEQILSRHPDVYSSFKVSVLAGNLNEAMDPSIWPEGAYVQRFVNFKREGK